MAPFHVGLRSRRLPTEIQQRTLIKLKLLNRAKTLDDLRNPPSNRLHALDRNRLDSDWLHNAHAGELLMSEFMEPVGLGVAALAEAIAIDAPRLQAVIDGSVRIDGELDLRLARYFRMSEGFFLGLQDDYELLEAKRALNGALDRIVPRAA